MASPRLWLALAALVAVGLVAAPSQAQVQDNRVGLVVQFSPDRVVRQCVAYTPGMTGLDLLRQVAPNSGIKYQGSQGALVCSIDLAGVREGCPTDDCLCRTHSLPWTYWAYWTLEPGGWRYASRGASSRTLHPGDVDGWAWGEGTVDLGARLPEVSFRDICQPPTLTPTLAPTSTFTPIPTITPTRPPSLTPTITLTPWPTITPRPTDAPLPTLALEPTWTPAALPTDTPPPDASATPEAEPTATLGPTAIPFSFSVPTLPSPSILGAVPSATALPLPTATAAPIITATFTPASQSAPGTPSVSPTPATLPASIPPGLTASPTVQTGGTRQAPTTSPLTATSLPPTLAPGATQEARALPPARVDLSRLTPLPPSAEGRGAANGTSINYAIFAALVVGLVAFLAARARGRL